MAKKAQYSIVMAMIFIAVGFVMMSGLYFFSNTIKDNSARTVGANILEAINGKMETAILDLKYLNRTTIPWTISRTINIPENIGDQQYTISGKNDTLRIQTTGKNTLTLVTNISKIWDVNLEGLIHSTRGQVTLEFVRLQDKISIK